MDRQHVTQALLSYVRENFLDGDAEGELDERTPLLEWGILTSMNTAILLTHIRESFGAPVPPDRINAGNFRDIRSIADLVLDLTPAGR